MTRPRRPEAPLKASGLQPIRPAVAADLDDIWALNREAFAEAWSRAALEESLRLGRDLVVWRAISGDLAAYWMSQDAADETHILQLAVASAWRGRGLGRALTGAMLERKRRQGIRAAWLEVRAGNRVARALYASLGFVEAGVRPNYYTPVCEGAPREAAVVMRLDLTNGEAG